jgi:hypothetical protein
MGVFKPDKSGCKRTVKGDGGNAETAKLESKTSIPKIVINFKPRICKFSPLDFVF